MTDVKNEPDRSAVDSDKAAQHRAEMLLILKDPQEIGKAHRTGNLIEAAGEKFANPVEALRSSNGLTAIGGPDNTIFLEPHSCIRLNSLEICDSSSQPDAALGSAQGDKKPADELRTGSESLQEQPKHFMEGYPPVVDWNKGWLNGDSPIGGWNEVLGRHRHQKR